MWRALMMLAALGGIAVAAPPESASLGAHTVVVPAKKLGFVMSEGTSGAELVAVDLATGKRRWTSTTAVKPIGVRGNSLVALDGAGNALVLDARTGAKAKPCSAIAGVKAPFVDGLGVNQVATGYDDGTTLHLTWERSTHYAGGAAPSPEMEARARSHSEATWAIDVASCTAKKAKLPPRPPVGITASTDVITPSGKTARITRDAKTGAFTLVPAGRKTAIDLTEGDPKRTHASISADRRYVACGEPAQNAAIFDLETGAVTHPKAFRLANAWLSFGTTIITGGAALGAVDASSGKVLWTIAERPTWYRGPYPPSAAR